MTKPGTRDWNDSAERSEWSFMAKMMREAAEFIPHRLSGLRVAIDIADARSKSGWRTAKDNDAAPDLHSIATDQAAEIERLRDALATISSASKHYAKGDCDLSYAHQSTHNMAAAALAAMP